MISAIEFLAVLKKRTCCLRRCYLTSTSRLRKPNALTAAELSQTLIDQGYLTPALANRLMGWNLEQSSGKGSAKSGPESGSHVNLGRPSSTGSSIPIGSHSDSSTVPRKERIEPKAKKEDEDDELEFAACAGEREPRPMLGKHRAYKTGDSSKTSGSGSSASKAPTPANVPPSPPKNPMLDKPPPSRWASSVYDMEVDSSKGIVSPSLLKLAGTETDTRKSSFA